MRLPSNDELQDLELRAQRGLLAEQFLAGPLWKNFIEPKWDTRPVDFQVALSMPENRDGLEKVGLTALFQSGRFAELMHWKAELKSWVESGKSARRRLEAMKETLKRTEEIPT